MSTQFAWRVGVRKFAVHYWRNNQSPVTLDALCRIAVASEVSIASLVQGKLNNGYLQLSLDR
ncbi:hypothetical protein [Orrella marina]|uniref:hypothetical protein n=1 Tax=Orrella marina TaxID=2163011 RepID=UPI00131F2198|nr:hypothetical protein [Orrella marina]